MHRPARVDRSAQCHPRVVRAPRASLRELRRAPARRQIQAHQDGRGPPTSIKIAFDGRCSPSGRCRRILGLHGVREEPPQHTRTRPRRRPIIIPVGLICVLGLLALSSFRFFLFHDYYFVVVARYTFLDLLFCCNTVRHPSTWLRGERSSRGPRPSRRRRTTSSFLALWARRRRPCRCRGRACGRGAAPGAARLGAGTNAPPGSTTRYAAQHRFVLPRVVVVCPLCLARRRTRAATRRVLWLQVAKQAAAVKEQPRCSSTAWYACKGLQTTTA